MDMTMNKYRIEPIKFGLWLGFASITMIFMAFTSAYLVRQAAGNWLEFQLPSVFYLSTTAIVLSSITLQISYESFKKGNIGLYRGLLVLTVLLGLAFVVLQYEGWLKLSSLGILIDGNPSASFVYIISAVHVFHVLGGITVLIIALFHAFALKYYVTAKRKLRFQLTLQYWHFVDILWVYLLVFFIIN